MVEFVLLVLASWRLTSLIVQEDGPFEIFARLRRLIGVRYDEYNQPIIYTNTFARGITCVWCASMWVSFLASFLSPYSANVRTFIFNWLGISALVIAVNETIDWIGRASRRV